VSTKIQPIEPTLFGEPFPYGHPWYTGQSSRLYENTQRRTHLLVQGSAGCTVCNRGIRRCRGQMPVTRDVMRTNCAQCLRAGVAADARLSILARQCEASCFRDERCRLWRAIAWWRSTGSTATITPGWFSMFFSADADLTPKQRKRKRLGQHITGGAA
jgi:hypothetical protein